MAAHRRWSGWLPAAFSLLLMLLPSCSEPDTLELFVQRDTARDGVYRYTFPLTDTTAAYDFWFYSRTERGTLESVQLNVRWMAPSGDSFAETVYMRSIGPDGARELYRSGMVPAQAGDWQLSVRPADPDEDLSGLGIIVKKNNGTR